jgi:hypothetical protein
MRSIRVLAGGLLAASLSVASPMRAQAPAVEWPQWGGPTRNGSLAPAQVPAAWPASFAPAWRVDLG